MSSEADFDYSPAAFERILGSQAMALIERAVAAAPPPSPELVERVRRIFEPTVRQFHQEDPDIGFDQPLAA